MQEVIAMRQELGTQPTLLQSLHPKPSAAGDRVWVLGFRFLGFVGFIRVYRVCRTYRV